MVVVARGSFSSIRNSAHGHWHKGVRKRGWNSYRSNIALINDELDSLTQLIKKVKIRRKATDRMLAAHLLDNPEIILNQKKHP